MSRDKLAGLQHGAELAIGLVGFFGWLWWYTHPKTVYHVCNCKED